MGYDVEYLLFQMSRELGLTKDWHVVIAGVGNLGHALANYGGFGDRGFPVAALVDADPRVVGTVINGITVRHINELGQIAAEHQIAIGIIATPASAAQEVADRMIEAGMSSILNFAPTIVSVPPDVSLRKVDLAVELQILSFYQQRKAGADAGASANAGRVSAASRRSADARGSPPCPSSIRSTRQPGGRRAAVSRGGRGPRGGRQGPGPAGAGAGHCRRARDRSRHRRTGRGGDRAPHLPPR